MVGFRSLGFRGLGFRGCAKLELGAASRFKLFGHVCRLTAADCALNPSYSLHCSSFFIIYMLGNQNKELQL